MKSDEDIREELVRYIFVRTRDQTLASFALYLRGEMHSDDPVTAAAVVALPRSTKEIMAKVFDTYLSEYAFNISFCLDELMEGEDRKIEVSIREQDKTRPIPLFDSTLTTYHHQRSELGPDFNQWSAKRVIETLDRREAAFGQEDLERIRIDDD